MQLSRLEGARHVGKGARSNLANYQIGAVVRHLIGKVAEPHSPAMPAAGQPWTKSNEN